MFWRLAFVLLLAPTVSLARFDTQNPDVANFWDRVNAALMSKNLSRLDRMIDKHTCAEPNPAAMKEAFWRLYSLYLTLPSELGPDLLRLTDLLIPVGLDPRMRSTNVNDEEVGGKTGLETVLQIWLKERQRRPNLVDVRTIQFLGVFRNRGALSVVDAVRVYSKGVAPTRVPLALWAVRQPSLSPTILRYFLSQALPDWQDETSLNFAMTAVISGNLTALKIMTELWSPFVIKRMFDAHFEYGEMKPTALHLTGAAVVDGVRADVAIAMFDHLVDHGASPWKPLGNGANLEDYLHKLQRSHANNRDLKKLADHAHKRIAGLDRHQFCEMFTFAPPEEHAAEEGDWSSTGAEDPDDLD